MQLRPLLSNIKLRVLPCGSVFDTFPKCGTAFEMEEAITKGVASELMRPLWFSPPWQRFDNTENCCISCR
jgi:hypothetical protein